MKSSKNVISYSLYLLLACVVISFFIGYRYANYTTVRYIKRTYPTINEAYDDLQEGDTITVYSNEIIWPNAR